MRADAHRNRERLLTAATELMLEAGGEVPLDAIARRAGVGIGTLYRHFPDRYTLLNAVAESALEQAIDAAQTALDETGDGYAALRRYMHTAVRHGVGVLNLIYPLMDDRDWTAQRTKANELFETMLGRAKRDGRILDDVEIGDIVFAVIRYSRPVEVGLDRTEERALAHRHLDIYVDGLAASGGSPAG